MADDLPNEFDLVVIGTGFTESCVAAAASRIGKTVLHIDANEYYGGVWASFNLETLNELFERGTNAEIQNATYSWHESPVEKTEETLTDTVGDVAAAQLWTRSKLIEKSRRFNIDLCPKILYSAGELVKLLVQSNICRYAEFRAVDHVCTLIEDTVINVPCSRSDVFNTKDLNIVEKRLLMKFLNSCLSYDAEAKCEDDTLAYRGKTFYEYLRGQRVTDKIATCVMQAIAMCNAETSFEEGMRNTQRFLSSLGRYGNTPFLFPMYGCGEIPQCFCRLCAVFGGIYCLKWPVTSIQVDSETGVAQVNVSDKCLRTKHIVCSHSNVPEGLAETTPIHGYGKLRPQLSRGIFIGTSPLGTTELNKGGGGVNLLRLTSAALAQEAILIQLSHFSGTCPEGIFIFHLTTPALSSNPAQDLAPFVAQVFKPNSSELLYSAYFTITARLRTPGGTVSTNTLIHCVDAPNYELDYDSSIQNAQDIFAKLYPTDEFLPRAPDPEEIVIDGEDPRALSEHNLPDDLREQLHALEEQAQSMEIEDTTTTAPQQMEAE